MRNAVVLGGGVAGIAAAFGLRDLGLDVELWESRGWLGGRAFSPPDKASAELGRRIDNGPHVMLGCYDHMRGLLRRIGTEHAFERPRSLRLEYFDDGGRRAKLALPPLVPTALALPAAILAMRGVPLGVRLRAMRGMAATALGAPATMTFGEWIERHGQTGGPRSWFWDPLCRAIMNAEAELVSARLFLRTLRLAFQGRASRAAIWSPARPWSEIIGDAAERQCAREGIVVRKGARVAGFDIEAGHVRGVRMSGEDNPRVLEQGTLVMSALPWHVVAPWIGDSAGELKGSPIVSVYFDCASHAESACVPAAPVQALVDGEPFHFVCRTPGSPPGEFAVLSGGNRSMDHASVGEIERLARRQLAKHYPAVPFDGAGVTARVVRENRATFLAEPGSAVDRPPAGRHPIARNLFVCGDWTDSGLPSTLEGGVLSGGMAVTDVVRLTAGGGRRKARVLG